MSFFMQMYISIYNKLFSSNIFIYFLFFNIFLLFYLYIFTFNNFFKIIINFLLLLNFSFLVAFFNADFFSAFLLVTELPIILIFLIFYFHKHSLQVDNIYKYSTHKKTNKFIFLSVLVFFFFFICIYTNQNYFILFYNFLINDVFFIANKNDFLLIFLSFYKYNISIIFLFAILIFFVSLLVIFIHQLNKLFIFSKKQKNKNILILRKQNILKQATHTSKTKFFKKKI